MFLTRSCHCTTLLVLAIVVSGCGDKDGPVPFSGAVKLDGQPLAGATVYFIHQDPEGRDALGSTDTDGLFSLSTFEPGDGALAGKYKVIVQPPVAGARDVTSTNVLEAMAASNRAGRAKGPTVTIPPRYSNPGQTILVQDVPADGEVVFELTSK